MVGLGFLLTFGGYSLFAYGFSQIRGQNAGFVQMLWPQKSFAPVPPDAGASQGPPTAPTAQNPNPSNPITAPPRGASGPVRDTPFPPLTAV
jgi:hypothetical protein